MVQVSLLNQKDTTEVERGSAMRRKEIELGILMVFALAFTMFAVCFVLAYRLGSFQAQNELPMVFGMMGAMFATVGMWFSMAIEPDEPKEPKKIKSAMPPKKWDLN